MTEVSFREWKVATGSALLRPIAGMLIAAGVIQLLGLQGREAAMLLVFALPPAVLNFLFAERYKQEPERVASIVLDRRTGADFPAAGPDLGITLTVAVDGENRPVFKAVSGPSALARIFRPILPDSWDRNWQPGVDDRLGQAFVRGP